MTLLCMNCPSYSFHAHHPKPSTWTHATRGAEGAVQQQPEAATRGQGPQEGYGTHTTPPKRHAHAQTQMLRFAQGGQHILEAHFANSFTCVTFQESVAVVSYWHFTMLVEHEVC